MIFVSSYSEFLWEKNLSFLKMKIALKFSQEITVGGGFHSEVSDCNQEV